MSQNKIRVADYVAKTLADVGVKHVFMVTGGGAMHLNDAFACEKRITPVFNHHEQACAIAAEGYARVQNRFAVINVTTGPGGLNALNGVFGAYTDSIPMFVVSGQVKTETMKTRYPELNLRQLGDQEVDIISVVKGITKYAVQVSEASQIRKELEKCLYLATHGRLGPVWLDIPVDIQGTLIDPTELVPFDSSAFEAEMKLPNLKEVVTQALTQLMKAKRPTLLIGNGVRLSGALEKFYKLADLLKIPVCPAWMMDFIPTDYPYFCGIQGTIGDRAGNFVVQNSDYLLILGSRLQIRQISYTWKNFARSAYKVHVDIDRGELNKPTLSTDLKVCADLNDFLDECLKQLESNMVQLESHDEWMKWAKARKERYHPVVLERHRSQEGKINPYHFFENLSDHLSSRFNIVAGNASACVMSFPTIKIHPDQRIFTNAGCASMGYDLPAAFGAALANPSQTTICLAGDGSIMMNLQELQTVKQYNPNLKIIVINNGGYLSIRSTQANFFGRLYGEGPESGVTLPDFSRLGEAFGLKVFRLDDPKQMNETLSSFLRAPGAVLLDVIVDAGQTFEPKLSSKKLPDGKMVSAPLEDMWPFLDRKEFNESMVVDILPESLL